MEYKLEYITEKDFLKAKDDSLEQSRLIEEERYSAVCQATIPERWIGTTPQVSFGGNTVLQGEEYPIIGNTRQEVIDRVIEELKARGVHGKLQVRNA